MVYERGFVDVADGGPPLPVRRESVGGPVRIGPDGCRAITVLPVGAVEHALRGHVE